MLIAVLEKELLSFVIIFGILSFFVGVVTLYEPASDQQQTCKVVV